MHIDIFHISPSSDIPSDPISVHYHHNAKVFKVIYTVRW